MLFASTFTIGKAVLQYLNPIFFIGLRMTIAGTILLAWLYFFKRDKFFIKKEHWFLFLQIIIFHIYIAYVFEFWALKYLSSFKTAFLYNLSPFISAIFAYLFLSEKMSLKKWVGLLIGFSGIILVLLNGHSSQEIVSGVATEGKSVFFFLSWPEISLLTAVCSSVYGWVVFKKLGKIGGYSSLMINGFGMFCAGLLAFVTSFFTEGSCCCVGTGSGISGDLANGFTDVVSGATKNLFSLPISDLFLVFGYTFLLIILANIVGYNLYGYLLKKYSITFLSFSCTITPFFAALFGAIFLGEVPSLTFFLSSTLVVIGLYIFYMQELKLRA